MKVGVFSYEINTTIKNNRTYRRFILTFISEFSYNNTLEYIQKYKLYSNTKQKIYFSELEADSNYYIYVRKRKYQLTKGVNII